MSEGTDDPRLHVEGELALARLALDEGDLRPAAGHLAGAIAYAPTMPEVHEALARFAGRTAPRPRRFGHLWDRLWSRLTRHR